MGMLENYYVRYLETRAGTNEGWQAPIGNAELRPRKPLVCHNGLQYAKGCASSPARTSREQSKSYFSQLTTRIVSTIRWMDYKQVL